LHPIPSHHIISQLKGLKGDLKKHNGQFVENATETDEGRWIVEIPGGKHEAKVECMVNREMLVSSYKQQNPKRQKFKSEHVQGPTFSIDAGHHPTC
jgi:hypothetical protein